MEERIAMLSIIIEDTESVARMNSILHEYSENIIGRMGILTGMRICISQVLRSMRRWTRSTR